ncbi:FCD domain-containing protein [Brucella intermedia]|uniref:FCD domain-containing protein n=1 Tax=Brucella intermedia TaxID=94625 RepID=UPI002360C8C1|nr:FCD domain-containing protein [Brucella intermedia]
MSELEGAARARAAQRFATDDKLALLAVHDQFHKVIYAASHCGFLAEQYLMLHKCLRPYRRLQLRVHNRMRTSIQEHTEIVDAILGGDASTARELLRNHVAIQGDRFNDLMSTIARAFGRKE